MIKQKQDATIVSRAQVQFNAATFENAKDPRFHEVTAHELLTSIKPKVFEGIYEKPIIAVDTETYAYPHIESNRLPSDIVRRWIKPSNKEIPNDFPFCISISDGEDCYVVYDTIDNKFAEFAKLKELLTNPDIAKAGHNVDFDLHMLANAKVPVAGKLIDTSIISRLVRANAFTHNLFDIAKERQNLNQLSSSYCPTVLIFEQMLDSYKSQNRITDYRKFPRELMTQYTCADTWNVMCVLPSLFEQLVEFELIPLFEYESKVVRIAFEKERVGIKINKEVKEPLISELTLEAEEAERKIYERVGYPFNINSSQQLYNVLCLLGYEHLIKFNPPTPAMLAKGIIDGNPCLDKYALMDLEAAGVPIIKDISIFRKAEKLLNTFAIKIYTMNDGNDILHCSINTIEAKTGRFSISMPSMQNIPRRGDSRVRDAFIAPEDYTLYDFDFKSQEAIILAHYSKSPYLMDIINSGKDIHKAVAAVIYSLTYDEVSKELREIAKSVEFAIVYGAGADKVSDMTGLTIPESKYAINAFKANVPEVATFINTANKIVKERGYIKTILGRRVYTERGREYACVNYVIQGSAADSTKTKMALIYSFLKANNYKSYMCLQVHDSLLYCIHKDEEEFILGYLRWLQTERELFRVPVTVDVSICEPTWRTKKEINVVAVQPTADQLARALNYNIWSELSC